MNKITKFLLEYNKRQSEQFCLPDAHYERERFRARHPVEMIALQCMDGRINIGEMTGVRGIIQEFRDLGGKFDLGTHYFGEYLLSWLDYAVLKKNRMPIVIVSYHWSEGDHLGEHKLGCKGFHYDVTQGIEYTRRFSDDMHTVFGDTIHVVRIGIDTDSGALKIHGDKDVLFLRDFTGDDESLHAEFVRVLPHAESFAERIMPFLNGNLLYIQRLKNSTPQKLCHSEQALLVGHGFEWMKVMNKALIVSPYSFNLANGIEKAAGILMENMEKGEIPQSEGCTLMVSATYAKHAGSRRIIADIRARDLSMFAYETIREKVPDLIPHLDVIYGTTNVHTRKFKALAVQKA